MKSSYFGCFAPGLVKKKLFFITDSRKQQISVVVNFKARLTLLPARWKTNFLANLPTLPRCHAATDKSYRIAIFLPN
jgi:hypothetical protein